MTDMQPFDLAAHVKRLMELIRLHMRPYNLGDMGETETAIMKLISYAYNNPAARVYQKGHSDAVEFSEWAAKEGWFFICGTWCNRNKSILDTLSTESLYKIFNPLQFPRTPVAPAWVKSNEFKFDTEKIYFAIYENTNLIQGPYEWKGTGKFRHSAFWWDTNHQPITIEAFDNLLILDEAYLPRNGLEKKQWWEQLTEAQMPRFVKNVSDSRVFSYINKDNDCAYLKDFGWHSLYDLLPATEDEFKKQQDK